MTEIECIITVTPPGNEYEELDGTCLGDDIEQIGRGIEKATDFTFKEIWSISDHASDTLNTMASSGNAGTGSWQIVSSNGTTMTFPGTLMKLGPESIEKNKYLMRDVTVKRTGDIVYS